jgi:hypothetical protein
MGVYLDMRELAGQHPNRTHLTKTPAESSSFSPPVSIRTWPDGTLILDSKFNTKIPTYDRRHHPGISVFLVGTGGQACKASMAAAHGDSIHNQLS